MAITNVDTAASPSFLMPFITAQRKQHACRGIFHIMNIPNMPESGFDQNVL